MSLLRVPSTPPSERAAQAWAAIHSYNSGAGSYADALAASLGAVEADRNLQLPLSQALGMVTVDSVVGSDVWATTPRQAASIEAARASGEPFSSEADVHLLHPDAGRYELGQEVNPLLEGMFPYSRANARLVRAQVSKATQAALAARAIEDDGGSLAPANSYEHYELRCAGIDIVPEPVNGVQTNVYYMDGQAFYAPRAS